MANVSISTINTTFEPMAQSKRCAAVVREFVYTGTLEGYKERMIALRRDDPYRGLMITETIPGNEEMLSSLLTDVFVEPEVTKIGNTGYRFSWGVQKHQFVEDELHVVFARDTIVFEVKKRITEPETCTVTATCDYPPYMEYFDDLIKEHGIDLVESNTQKVVTPQPPILSQKEQGKRRTNPGVRAHADAIQRLVDGQERHPNYYQWRTEYQAERGPFTEKSTFENELYRKNVWNPYRKKLTGKI